MQEGRVWRRQHSAPHPHQISAQPAVQEGLCPSLTASGAWHVRPLSLGREWKRCDQPLLMLAALGHCSVQPGNCLRESLAGAAVCSLPGPSCWGPGLKELESPLPLCTFPAHVAHPQQPGPGMELATTATSPAGLPLRQLLHCSEAVTGSGQLQLA